jgi:hypothetical protein
MAAAGRDQASGRMRAGLLHERKPGKKRVLGSVQSNAIRRFSIALLLHRNP